MKVVDEALLDRFRLARRCEWCGRPTPGCDPAHIHSRGAGRVDIAANLLALCRECHNRSHTGKIHRLLMLVVAGHREAVLVSDIEEEVWRLRRE